ncbi:hypothetical protein B4U80_07153 [Leptotrombidium deliense]|uniref:Mitochondrial inner membrane protein Mpv17 n=1 Tax=Leptotrombidium deliense TaxID=299467 RepID=A0A443SLR1_9ACAR|nr:hypothetical protein B4U80_07153 [Leptotrombidium deliense]
MVTIGDTVAQRVIEKKKKQDYKRTARFAVFNFFVVGPAFRTWYYTLERLIRRTNKWAPLKRVLIDQTMFAPFFIAVSILILELMKGNNRTIALYNLRQIYPDILANNYKIWPFAQLINFYLVPSNKRFITYSLIFLIFFINIECISLA